MEKKKVKVKNTYIKNVEAYLKEKYGAVNAEWALVLTMLRDNVELYNNCKVELEKNGIYDATTGRKNPLLATVKDIQATIMKQVQHLGLSPYAAGKLKENDTDDDDEFINNLCD